MQKIIVKNFGPIGEAEIDLKKVIALIGEQASGKSTISKLIFYFKSLRKDLFDKIYNQTHSDSGFEFDYVKSLIFPAREKFYDFFGSTKHLRSFEITFFYSVEENKYLSLTLNKQKRLYPKFSDEFKLGELGGRIRSIRNLLPDNIDANNISEVLAYNQERLRYAERLSNLLKEVFCCEQDDNLYILAGRNATVGYSESFENQFLINTHSQYESSYKKKQQTIDETLMLEFVDRVVNMKGMFKKFGDFNSFLGAVDSKKKKELKTISDKIEKILKGKYQIDNWGEKIVFSKNNSEHIYLSNASSGQQEVIRILQDIFLSVAQNTKNLRIVEEPEAHLFPIAQKNVIELLIQMANSNEYNQLIITTHSPYVLTVLNNLLFAKRIVIHNPLSETGVSEVISKNSFLSLSDFSAYSLMQGEEKGVISESIIDNNTGLINQNYLDTVSETLANEFNQLYSIHSKSYKR